MLFYKKLPVIILLLLISACSKNNKDQNYLIGFSQCTSNAEWRKDMNYSMKVEASVHSNVSLTIRDSKDDPEQQIRDIEDMIEEGIDVIIVSPLEPDLIVAPITRAINAGIPVILLDRKINSNNYTAYLGADNIEIGRNAGKYILSSTKETVNVIEVRGGDSSTPVVERSLGFHQIADNNSRIHIIGSIDGSNGGLPKEKFKNLLDSLDAKNIDYAYFFNDEMALDAWRVAKELGVENEIKFIGVDGLNGPDGGIQMVQDGILDATLLYPTGGSEVIKLALKILNGEEAPKNSLLATTVIDKLNAGIMKDQLNRINQQQTEIEHQVETITEKEELYTSQNILLKLSILFIIIILSLTAYTIYSIIAIRKKNRQLQLTNTKITIQRNQIEKIANQVKESNEAKINFFTGLSHELKTPITLILSSIESIGETVKEKGSKLGNEVELIYNNSNRLLRLINQLLDFRKSEDRKFMLKASKTNVYDFSINIYNEFKREAKKRNINFYLKSNNKNLDLYFDRNLMDKVYFNILSNAFKFTPDNGKIEIEIVDVKDKKYAQIIFKDSGIGIPEKELNKVFEAFFKGSNNRKNSSGIGLHLTKELIDLHKGMIKVKSLKGSEFTVILNKGKSHFSSSEIIHETDVLIDEKKDLMADLESNYYVESNPVYTDDQYGILIIEDNKELSGFLSNKLSEQYNIYLSDGTDALDKAFDLIPDIILCDINLPEKDGFEICEELKKDLRTSHIPTVILTALSDKESYIKGLQAGADLYLTKPFSYSILIQSLKSLLYNREKLRFYFTNNVHKIEETDSFGNMEQAFLCRINEAIDEHIEDSHFSVENLADILKISRVQLYRKVKALLGISISEYINEKRLA
ncbi:MAG: substrate-binding domain-containing protein, partial [Leeuwenhoekiella sp.]